MTYRYESVYKVVINDDLGSPTYWNTRWQDIDVRINALEQSSLNLLIAGAVDEITQAGISRINQTITPLINNTTDEITALQVTVAALQALVVTDQDNIIGQLNSLLATAQGIVANLQSLGTIQDGTF